MLGELAESTSFALLASRHRRLTLRILQEEPTPLSAVDVARRIGQRTSRDPSCEEVRTAYLKLHHAHLPRLDAAGVVVYDRDEGTLRPGVNFDDLLRLLEAATDREPAWSDG